MTSNFGRAARAKRARSRVPVCARAWYACQKGVQPRPAFLADRLVNQDVDTPGCLGERCR